MFTFKLRRGIAAEWLAKNPVLRDGEPAVESDTGLFKIGNGIDRWVDLPSISGSGTPGPQGPQGPPGADGLTGPQGPPGADGISNGFPLSEWQNAHSASVHPDSVDSSSSVGQTFFARVLIPAGKSITKVATGFTAAASSPSATDGYAVYDDTGAKIGQTAGDNTLFASVGLRWGNLVTPIPSQSSNRWVYVTLFAANPSGLSIRYKNGAGDLAGATALRRAFFDSPGSLPSSINPATTGITSPQYIPFYLIG